MSLQPVAVLGLDGWVFTPKEKMDNLFMHFVEANYSQSTLSRGQAFSFQRVLFDCNNVPGLLVDQLKKVMTTYFGGYYTEVNCEIAVLPDPAVGDALILRIYLTAKDEYGKVFNLAKESSDVNSKTVRWANLNNYGDENVFAQ
jgi:hypothetical protein